VMQIKNMIGNVLYELPIAVRDRIYSVGKRNMIRSIQISGMLVIGAIGHSIAQSFELQWSYKL
jgi:hypothetical protein